MSSYVRKRPVITVISAEPLSASDFKSCTEKKCFEFKNIESIAKQIQLFNNANNITANIYSKDNTDGDDKVKLAYDPPKKPPRPPIPVILKSKINPVPVTRKSLNTTKCTSPSILDSKFNSNVNAGIKKDDEELVNDIPKSNYTPNVCTESIAFKELKMKFGGNWMDNVHNNCGASKEQTSNVLSRKKLMNNNLTIIRPKTLYTNKLICEESIDTSLSKSFEDQASSNRNHEVITLRKTSNIPQKPTIIKPKPSLSMSMISLNKKENKIDSKVNNKKDTCIEGIDLIRKDNHLNVKKLENEEKDMLATERQNITQAQFKVSDDVHVMPLKPQPKRPNIPPKINQQPVPLAVALFDYDSGHPEDLKFKVNDEITLDSWVSDEWMKGYLKINDAEPENSKIHQGMFPSSFVQVLVPLPVHATTTDGDVCCDAANKVCIVEDHCADDKSQIENKFDASQETKLCRALYDFRGEKENRELSFKAGQLIIVTNKVNDEWIEGEMNENEIVSRGILPLSFVDFNIDSTEMFQTVQELNEKEKSSPANYSSNLPRKVIALYDFQSGHQGDLNFRAGEVINVLTEVDDDWLLGDIHNQTGIFPKNFVF